MKKINFLQILVISICSVVFLQSCGPTVQELQEQNEEELLKTDKAGKIIIDLSGVETNGNFSKIPTGMENYWHSSEGTYGIPYVSSDKYLIKINLILNEFEKQKKVKVVNYSIVGVYETIEKDSGIYYSKQLYLMVITEPVEDPISVNILRELKKQNKEIKELRKSNKSLNLKLNKVSNKIDALIKR
ncbi:MAG: hypothetical protein WC264_00735 [Candidatus Paceibacterota bacterium]|jgi:hypothetical protein